MNADLFFQKFDLLSDAPGAVAKLRELIMWAAFSGGFSSEEKNHPVPSEWKIEDTQRPAPIPASWEWRRGKDVFEVIRGVSYKKHEASESPSENSAPILRANNIGNGINFEELVYVPKQNIKNEQLLRNGDILIAMSSGSKKLVGKAATITTEFTGSFGAFCGVIRNKSDIPNETLSQYFQSPQYTAWVTSAGKGIGINNLAKGDLDSLPIPVPPLAEQKRIVAKVDELMALCDRLEARHKERDERHAALSRAALARFADAPTPDNLALLFHPDFPTPTADLRKTILSLAVQGKLVPQDPNDEPAEELLSKLMKRDIKNTDRRKKSQPDLSFTHDEIPFELPHGWAWERLGNIGETNIGLTYSPQDVSDTGIPVLRSSNIQNGKLDFGDLVRVKCEPKNSVIVQNGDLLICARNGSKALVGKVAVIKDLKEPAAFGAFMAIYRSEVNAYLYYFIRSPLFRQMIDDVNTTTINQITQANLRSTLAPIPPLAEQQRIVAKVDELMALVDRLEATQSAARAAAPRLLDAAVADLLAA